MTDDAIRAAKDHLIKLQEADAIATQGMCPHARGHFDGWSFFFGVILTLIVSLFLIGILLMAFHK